MATINLKTRNELPALDIVRNEDGYEEDEEDDLDSPSTSTAVTTPDVTGQQQIKGGKSAHELEMNKVQEELEKLNIATDVINKLELQLDNARSAFAEIQSIWTQQLDKLTKKLGNCIEKSRPYYEARLHSRKIQEEAQKAALRFERANSMQAVAKQQVSLTQDSLNRQAPKDVDPACLEVLNHHVQRVNEAERERISSEEEHRRISQLVEEASRRVVTLDKELSRHVKKSKLYFDRRLEFTRVLEEQKALIQRIQMEVKQKKLDYQTSLKNLEKISERIHAERRKELGQREAGVGAEAEPFVMIELARTTSNASDDSEKLPNKASVPSNRNSLPGQEEPEQKQSDEIPTPRKNRAKCRAQRLSKSQDGSGNLSIIESTRRFLAFESNQNKEADQFKFRSMLNVTHTQKATKRREKNLKSNSSWKMLSFERTPMDLRFSFFALFYLSFPILIVFFFDMGLW